MIQGQQHSQSFGTQLSAIMFVISQMMNRMCTATLVQVKAVSNDGVDAAVGTVDVQPMVNQLDGAGVAVSHGTVYSLPYFRLQGGSNAVILDPNVGDIGLAVIADHDISSVKKNKAVSNPGSLRRFDMADGLYIGGFLNAVPAQYIQFVNAVGGSSPTPAAINIVSTGKITLTDGAGSAISMNGDHTGAMTFTNGLTINATVQVNGAVNATGEGTFAGGHTVSKHTHTQGPDSAGNTEQNVSKPTG
jgi:hypothetical protein